MTLDKEYQIPFADSIIYPWRRVSDTLVRTGETMMDSAAEVTVKDALKAPKIVFIPKQKMRDAANAVELSIDKTATTSSSGSSNEGG